MLVALCLWLCVPVLWMECFNAPQVALYYIVLMYHVLAPLLKHWKPLLKFLSIKGMVFFTFWCIAAHLLRVPGSLLYDARQGVFIAGLVHFGWITATLTYTTEEIAAGLQSTMVCDTVEVS